MCCGIFGQGVQRALSLDMSPYEGEKPHLVVVRFILRRGQTNVEIEIREFEGGIRATGLLCLLGVGVGLCTFLAYKLCSQLHLKYFASSSVDNNSLKISCSPGFNAQVLDSGISLGIKKLRKPGVLHRSQLFEPQQVWRRKIIDWLARTTFPFQGESGSDDDDDVEYEDDQVLLRKAKKSDPMMNSTQSGWSSGFVSNPDHLESSCNNISVLHESGKEWLSCANEDELMDGIEEESEGCGVLNSDQLDGLDDDIIQHSWRNKRPTSGSATNEVQLIRQQGIRRNCFSFASHKSGDSSLYDYRESLVSKGFSVDLGENLDSVVLSNSREFVSCDQGSTGVRDQGAVDHIDWMQYELMKIRLDIDCLNQKFGDLCQPKADEPVNDVIGQQQIPEEYLNEKAQNVRRRSASVESRDWSPHQGSPETFDFIWDYHSDLAAIDQPSFVSARPGRDAYDDVFKGNIFNEDFEPGLNRDDDDDRWCDKTGIFSDEDEMKAGRRESIVLFYFDDDIDNNVVRDLERPRSISDISSRNHFHNLLLSDKSSSSKELQRSSNFLSSLESDSFSRLLKPTSPRHLRKSKIEENLNLDNNAGRFERIFSCEERRIVGDEKKLFEHLECDLNVDVLLISNIRKGYSKIFEMWGSSNVRSFRSERFSILGPITFQVLLQGLPILSDIGGNFQNSVQYLVAAIDNGHQYLMDWKYRGFLWAPKNEVLFKLINSLRIFCEQAATTRRMTKKKCREQYLTSLLNHSTDMEVHLVEALKVVIMLKIISSSKVNHKHPSLEQLYGPSLASAELVFRNIINTIEDGTIFDDIQLSFLSATLGVGIEILSPSQWGTEGFARLYPTMLVRDSSRWDKISMIEDDPSFLYCLPAIHSDE